MKKNGRPAVFLDRDGTINEQVGYVNHISRFHLLPKAAAAIRLLNRRKIPVIIVTNQSGLARGYFSKTLLAEVHAKMNGLLRQENAFIDGLYICPHHPEAKEPQYRRNCSCRKPKTGLLEQAALEMKLDLSSSYMVGDRWSDIECGARAGTSSILVLSGYGRGDQAYIGPTRKIQPEYTAEDLLVAAQWIVNDLR